MYENGSDNGSTLESKSPFKLLKSFSVEEETFIVFRKPTSTSIKSQGKKFEMGASAVKHVHYRFQNWCYYFSFFGNSSINVRRRARMLKDYFISNFRLICYALIDDITDSFAP